MTRILLGAICAAALAAQQQPAPTFDVVSIRVVPPNTPPTLREQSFTPVLPGGQYVDSRASLYFMIAFAWQVKNPSTQLVGLPKWAQEQSFAVAAKAATGFPDLPPSENTEQVRLMLRAMLADRFHLQVHTETRQEPILVLETAKSGIRIREVDPPAPPSVAGHVNAAMGNSGGRMIGKKSTMAGMASVLTMFLKRLVVDRTGLKGYYDFDVKWTGPEVPDSDGFGPEGAGLLISTLRSQFGLLLTNTTGPVEYWVVDRVEMPTEN
jgi:uncharacterized protein (TIGR03435 family)